jgi:integrase
MEPDASAFICRRRRPSEKGPYVKSRKDSPLIQSVFRNAGYRRGEITGLTWREIDTAGSVIRLDPERSKTKTGRLLPLSEPLKEVLKRRIAARRLDVPLVFHRDGEPLIDWRKAWEACLQSSRIPRQAFARLPANGGA